MTCAAASTDRTTPSAPRSRNRIRPTKLDAKNWLFIGCSEAGQKTAILYTIVENCWRLGIGTRVYLEDVLTGCPA